jgi:hypothetical protein
MPRPPDPGFPPSEEPDEPFPLHPAHVVNPERFPAPTWEQLSVVLEDREIAYLAWLVLLRAPPEFRVLARLAVALHHGRQAGDQAKAGCSP